MYKLKKLYDLSIDEILNLNKLNNVNIDIYYKYNKIFKNINNEIFSKFMEKHIYSYEYLSNVKIASPLTFYNTTLLNNYPDYILPEKVFKLYINLIEKLNNKDESNYIKKIEYEYFNLKTNKKGFMLENRIRIEDGVFVNYEIKSYDDEIKNFIEYIKNPEYRKNYILKEKLISINGNNNNRE